MSEKRFEDEVCCSNCRNQMTGFDGGFFGLPFTCECRIYGETEGRKNCSDFEKKITKSYLLNKIKELEKENAKLKKEYKIAIDELITDYKKLEKENEQLHLAIEDLLTHTSCEEVKKENSDLRQNIKIIKDLLSECDLFSDKAIEHDIIAYKEMNQFDNKDAYYMCISTKKAIKMLQRCLDE